MTNNNFTYSKYCNGKFEKRLPINFLDQIGGFDRYSFSVKERLKYFEVKLKKNGNIILLADYMDDNFDVSSSNCKRDSYKIVLEKALPQLNSSVIIVRHRGKVVVFFYMIRRSLFFADFNNKQIIIFGQNNVPIRLLEKSAKGFFDYVKYFDQTIDNSTKT